MILRTELRRSVAPVAGIGLLLISLALLYGLPGPWHKRTVPWDEEWTGLAQWTRSLGMFVWPLTLGAGAWQGLRDKRSKVPELFSTTPRAPWRRVLPTAVALALALTAGYLGLLVVGGVGVAGATNYFHLKWVPVAGVMVLALVGIALLGAGIGHLMPSLVTPPLLTVGALAAETALLDAGWARFLTPMFDGRDITLFTTVAVPVTLTQALWFAGMAATGFGLFVATSARTTMAALLPIALSAAVAMPVLANVDNPVVADPDAQALVCDDNGPRVCVTRPHADYLPTLVGPAREALALLDKLPSPPTSVVEIPSDIWDYRPPRSDVLPVLVTKHSPTEPAEVRRTLLAATDVPMCDDDWENWDRVFTARMILTAWFTGELAPVPGSTYDWAVQRDAIEQVWQAFQALPAEEQTARAQALWEAAIYCRGKVTL